jgi:hypothetical protein
MNEAAFREYLLQPYDPGEGKRYISSILSRCRKVEKVLGLDLEDVPDVTSLHGDVPSMSESKKTQSDIRSALNRYQDFKEKGGS